MASAVTRATSLRVVTTMSSCGRHLQGIGMQIHGRHLQHGSFHHYTQHPVLSQPVRFANNYSKCGHVFIFDVNKSCST